MNKQDYLYLEDMLRNTCNEINIPLGEIDYLLWVLGRDGYLDYVRCD